MKPMPSPNNTNLEGLYLAGPVAAYDSVGGVAFDTPPRPSECAQRARLIVDGQDGGFVKRFPGAARIGRV